MSKIDKIWNDLKDLGADAQVLSYWDSQQARILESLRAADSDLEIASHIIYRLAKSLNDREKYSAVYYLYKFGYQPIEKKFKQSNELNEVKYELGRGLHHNRKYDHSKQLFNDLANTDFDTSRIEGWWDQTVFASTRERVWLKTDLLPGLGRFTIILAYILIAAKTNEFLISTTIFIILFEAYEIWSLQFRVSSYLEEFEGNVEIVDINKKIKKKIFIQLGISLLFYPIYFLIPEWLLPLILIVAAYFQISHYGLSYYYLPKLIVDLDRKNTKSQQRNS